MRVTKIEETLTNLEIAHRQIERAIVLFLDDRDFVSALTLAGAAEEILGKLLYLEGKDHWLEELTKFSMKALGFRKREFQSPEALTMRKNIAISVNQYKNIFKHYNADGSVTLLVDVAAAKMISRAIANYFKLTRRETGAMCKFRELIEY